MEFRVFRDHQCVDRFPMTEPIRPDHVRLLGEPGQETLSVNIPGSTPKTYAPGEWHGAGVDLPCASMVESADCDVCNALPG